MEENGGMDTEIRNRVQARRKVFAIGAAKGFDPDNNVGGRIGVADAPTASAITTSSPSRAPIASRASSCALCRRP